MDKLYQLLNIEDSNAYVLSESYDFDDEYLFLTFEKMYENGVVNPLQSLNIVFNKNTLKFTIAVKFNSLPNAKEPIVSKAEAISVANSFSHGENVFSIAELTYIDDRTYNTNIHEYEDGICYLVYKITAPNVNTIIYVDALSGAYICRDIMMSETGFSVAIQESANSSAYNYNSDLSACSASEVRKFNSWRIDKMTWAASAMRRLGYVVTSSSYTDSTMNTDVRNYFKALSTEYAFYFTGHGDTSSIGFKRNHWITTDDVTGNWHFVFLDACSTAETTGWADAFKINGYTNRAYLGWNGKITWDNGYEFAEAFWPLINGQNTVRQAAVDAAALVPGAGTTPIKFYGDTSYTGVAWS